MPLSKADARRLTIAGLVVTLLGAGLATYGAWVSPLEAGHLAAARWSAPNDLVNSTLPLAHALLRQAHFSMVGLALVAVGTALQIGAVLGSEA